MELIYCAALRCVTVIINDFIPPNNKIELHTKKKSYLSDRIDLNGFSFALSLSDSIVCACSLDCLFVQWFHKWSLLVFIHANRTIQYNSQKEMEKQLYQSDPSVFKTCNTHPKKCHNFRRINLIVIHNFFSFHSIFKWLSLLPCSLSNNALLYCAWYAVPIWTWEGAEWAR